MSYEESHIQESLPEGLPSVEERVTVASVEGMEVIRKEEIAIDIASPFELDVSAFLPNITPLTLPTFFEKISAIIEDAQDREGIVSNKFIELTEEYPPDNFGDDENERICFRVLRREPARMNAKGTGRPQRGYSFYYDLIQPKDPNKVIIVESRPVDHRIEFSCWAKSNKLANARALWLEQLLTDHSWALQIGGVERFWWEDRGPDTYMMSGGQRLFYRPLNFFLRFREFAVRASPAIRNIQISYSLPNYIINTSTYED